MRVSAYLRVTAHAAVSERTSEALVSRIKGSLVWSELLENIERARNHRLVGNSQN
jgi:hypothetical protein